MYKVNPKYDLISVISLFVAVVAATGYLRFSNIVSASDNVQPDGEIILSGGWQKIENKSFLSIEKNDMMIVYQDKLESLDEASKKSLTGDMCK